MNPKNDRIYIADMLQAIDEIEQSQDLKINSLAIQRIVERNLEILGEAANRLSANIRDSYSDIPWRKIIGTRNIISHGYDGISEEILHSITQNDLPPLRAQLTKILEK